MFLFSLGFLDFDFKDVVDIALVSLLLYQVYKLMRGSVALIIFFGFLALYLIFLVVRAMEMELMSSILGQFMGVGVIAVIILFQQEIRKFLLLVGKTTTFNSSGFFNSIWSRSSETNEISVTPIIDALKTLSGSNTGGLVVISKDSSLKFYSESGDEIDARLSKRLLLSIFNKYSPLHDGAVILHHGRIKAARCILPVTERGDLPAEFGLRHRAAIGMSEVTDTIILVVSEETGQMSVVKAGKIEHNLSTKEIRARINEYLYDRSRKEGSEATKTLKEKEIFEAARKKKTAEKGSAKPKPSEGQTVAG
jgi:diadenylate cyclase